jgi:hypothetical protein
MEKSPTNSDDMSAPSSDDIACRDRDHMPVELPGQVLVTFRGVAVDENVVRYAQQCALELGWGRVGSLHALLTRESDDEPYVAVARGGNDTRRYEHCARADNALAALQAALDALRAQLGWTECAC